jgi:hypothetical protein
MSIVSVVESLDLEMTVKDVEVFWVSNDNDDWAAIAARKSFSKGEVIESDPVVILNKKDSGLVRRTSLREACYKFDEKLVIPGGYGPIYKTSGDNNASFTVIPEARALVITADRKIWKGEFIYVNGRWDHLKEEDHFLQPRIKYVEKSPWKADGLVVKPSPKGGLGTFTERKFHEGDIVEICNLKGFSDIESKVLSKTKANRYMYSFGSRNQLSGWAVGYPCFYNYSEDPNIYPWDRLESITETGITHLVVRALKDLKPGTELLFDYLGGIPKDKKRKLLGFDPL